MPRSVEEKLEHVKLKVFLYKFAPGFERNKDAETKQKSLAKVDRYLIDLDENSFFWKYDITDFVSNYSFTQNIDDNTYNWSLVLQDGHLALEDIDERLRVEGPKLTKVQNGQTVLDTTIFERIAEYDAEAREIADSSIILEAKQRRGITQPSLTVRVGDNLPTKTGIRLSDLIQRYDLISCFIYKNNTPLSELRGTIEDSTSTVGLPVFTLAEKKTGFVGRFKSAFKAGKKLTSTDLQKESILLSKVSSTGAPLFSNEFNGFVSSKTTTVNVNGVNVVNLTGNGITRLFGATRRVMKPSLFQSSIYDIAELVDPGQAVPFQNVYVNSSVQEIFADLFGIAYRIKFPTKKNQTFNFGRFFSQQANATTTEFLGTNFYDLSSLIVGNNLQTNVFTIPAFLLALVMKRRGFNFREPLEDRANQLTAVVDSTGVRADGTIVQSDVDEALNEQQNLQIKILTDQSPVFFSQELNELRAFFKLISEVFNFFNAALRTPFEIIDEVKDKTFLEFIERSDGVILVRAPQYNDRTSTVFSSDLEIQSATYREHIDGLISRQKVGYGTDIIETLEPIKEYSYSNGKLLLQYGFMEAGTDPNPNVKNDKVQDNELTESKENGLAKYAEFFLRLHNARLKSGTITCNLDSRVRVGKTFFDETNGKFGYITSVSKNIVVGDTATMSFELLYVRDAYLGDRIEKVVTTGQPVQAQTGTSTTVGQATLFETRKDRKDPRFIVVEQLPRLVDIAREFTKATPDTQIIDPEPDLVSFEA